MTRKPKPKVRFSRPAQPPAHLPPQAEVGTYFDVRPATLPPRLDGLHARTKPGVRGFPGVDDAQALLAQTLRKDRVRGDVLDLAAGGGLLG
ncbi:methyltransferase, partial [Deinococcus sp. MIMF12]|nr:methyltransferase [Deinococcus rhizophilus]